MSGAGRFNVPLKTLGGKQFWFDHYVYGGWRIQEHTGGRRWRLLDRRDVRRAWGSLAACREALDVAKTRGDAVQVSRHGCLLVHGLVRSKDSLARLARALRDDGYEPCAINYASTRASLPQLVERVSGLAARIASDYDRLSLVTHSMGGLVARGMLAAPGAPAVDRMVMIAPPNRGAALADRLQRYRAYRTWFGGAGMDVGTSADGYIATLPESPGCEFGIIAGGRGNERGWNPLIEGDDDGVVTVASTHLDGATDFVVVRAFHTLIMNAPETVAQTLHFLRHGRFRH